MLRIQMLKIVVTNLINQNLIFNVIPEYYEVRIPFSNIEIDFIDKLREILNKEKIDYNIFFENENLIIEIL